MLADSFKDAPRSFTEQALARVGALHMSAVPDADPELADAPLDQIAAEYSTSKDNAAAVSEQARRRHYLCKQIVAAADNDDGLTVALARRHARSMLAEAVTNKPARLGGRPIDSPLMPAPLSRAAPIRVDDRSRIKDLVAAALQDDHDG